MISMHLWLFQHTLLHLPDFLLLIPTLLKGCWTITDAATGALNPLSAPAPASPQPAIASLSLGGRGGAAGAAPSHLAKPKQGVVSAIAHMLDQQELARLAAQRAEYSQHGEPRQRQHQLAMIRAQCFTTPSRTPPPPINQALKVRGQPMLLHDCVLAGWLEPETCSLKLCTRTTRDHLPYISVHSPV
jgi:hypothetical protein